MAKRKRATALFDVIHKGRASAPASAAARWWWPRRPQVAYVPEPRRDQLATAAPASALVAPVMVSTPGLRAGDLIVGGGRSQAGSAGAGIAQAPVAGFPAAGAGTAMDMQVDRARQQITLRLSYRNVLVVAGACVAGIVLAYVVGSHMSRGPMPAIAAGTSTAELRAGPAHPEVMNVDAAANDTDGADAAPQSRGPAASGLVAGPTTGPAIATSPLFSFIDNPRVIGRQYVIVQSYPDRKSADEAVTLLSKNNIPCTVETGLPHYAAATWFCVVGLTGFDRIRNNVAYDHYVKSISLLSNQFGPGSKFKKFQPQAYAWKGS